MTVEAVESTPVAVAVPESTCPVLQAKILKQVEFYFGDANLPRDKFLQEKIKENDGWVQLSVLASFTRMKSLSEEVAIIAEAIEKSAELLELSEDRTCVRRKTDLLEAQDNLNTSVYVKGFSATATLDEIESFLASAFDGKVQAIRMRRNPKSKEFKGSVFVELATAEEAERLAGMTLSLPEATEPLVMHVKAKYFELKNAERTAKRKSDDSENAEEESRPFEYTKGCIVIVEAVPEGVTFEQIKEALGAQRSVAFADVANSVATIRFKEALPEGDSLPEDVATFKVAEHELVSRRATEEEEKAYYDAFLKSLRAKSAKQRNGRAGRGRGGKRQRN
jgi:lupus La protein